MKRNIQEYFTEEKIKNCLPDFEPRVEQVKMAEKVFQSFSKSENLIVEAGTGVGKSLAYIIPAAIFSMESETTVVISTETKSLQTQILEKDIPIAKKILQKEFRAEIALGSNNYVCKRKLSNTIDSGNFGIEMTDHLKEFYEWEKNTQTGIKSEYTRFASNEFWSKVTRESDNCLGKKCPNFSSSYYFLEKEKWRNSNILVVNHHLLASHIAGEYKILPEFSYLIIDEAHNFPEILSKTFGAKLTFEDIQKSLDFIYVVGKKGGIITKFQKEKSIEGLKEQIKGTNKLLVSYFNKLYLEVPISFTTQRIKEKLKLDEGDLECALGEIVEELSREIADSANESDGVDSKEKVLELQMVSDRLNSSIDILKKVRMKKEADLVVWLEANGDRFATLCVEPLQSSSIFQENVVGKMESIIFTSATLKSGKKDFSYYKNKLGDIPVKEEILNSPFDYTKNSILYLARNLRDPSSESDDFQEDVIKLIPYLLELTQGDTFVLFTSNKSMNSVYDALSKNSTYPIFSQGELGPNRAKEGYLKTEKSVLFGVSTFWQGIDIKGDKLKSVIIVKLPFQPPNDPVLEAKTDELKKLRLNPFMELQLPLAIQTMKQGFGRLIRSKTDTGVVSILDPRIRTKSYGSLILDSLPPAKIVNSFGELKFAYSKLPQYK
ncbi:MAG: DEAD/DEAH box helicase [Leptospiraceae bacterium]|nr:DEAD/DEAH box helicase [Leptospiraceae bacterium]